MAAAVVLAITELLEHILKQSPLDLVDLFRLQRVNTTFCDTIPGSTALARKMCISHPTTFEAGLSDFGTFHYLQFYAMLNVLPFEATAMARKRNSTGLSVPQICFHLNDYKIPSSFRKRAIGVKRKTSSSNPNYTSKGNTTYNRSSSWSKMLLTNEPMACSIVAKVVFMTRNEHGRQYTEVVELPADQQVTLGDLFTFLEKLVARTLDQHRLRWRQLGREFSAQSRFTSFAAVFPPDDDDLGLVRLFEL